jgi:hypothetical protein
MAAPPADAPAAPAPANGLDDLFGTDPAPAAPAADAPADKPAEKPAEKSDLNDLFNSNEPSNPSLDSGEKIEEPAIGRTVSTDMPEAASNTSDADVDALFGTPEAAKPVEKSDSSSSFDAIFDSPAPAKASEAAPEKAPESSLDSDLDDLFKTSSDNSADRESFRGAEFRTWNDNTGDFSVSARLSVIFPDRVRLLKDNGKFSTVPLSRLSQADQQYVGWVATSLQKPGATKLVNTQTDPGTSAADLTR